MALGSSIGWWKGSSLIAINLFLFFHHDGPDALVAQRIVTSRDTVHKYGKRPETEFEEEKRRGWKRGGCGRSPSK
jgi:hypothetical protein